MTDIQKQACRIIYETYEHQQQIDKTIEEVAELQLVLIRLKDCETLEAQNEYITQLIDEIADVTIMLEQMKIAYVIDKKFLDKKIQEKLNRQYDRIGRME